MIGALLLARALADAGSRHLFNLSGNQIMPLYDPLIDSGVELVHTRHEAAAVHMADAYARLTERPCPILLTAGPGHANALGALYTARMAQSPVVVLSGASELATRGRGAFQEIDQPGLARRVCKAAWTARDPGRLAHDLARAYRLAAADPPGPVSLSLPADVLRANVDAPRRSPLSPWERARVRASSSPEERPSISPGARRPLLLCGPSWSRGARWQAAQATGLPAIPMESPRGPNDPALGAIKRIFPKADTILLLGKSRDFTLQFGRPPLFAETAHFVELDGPPSKGEVDPAWAAEVEAALAERPSPPDGSSGPIHPFHLARAATSGLGPDDVFISDGGEVGQWAQSGNTCRTRVINGPSGAIGGALPFAIGASLARPDACVVSFSGDGAVGYHIAELHTAVRHGTPFVLIVGNDRQWNAEVVIQRNLGGRPLESLTLGDLRYDEVARAFGAHAERVDAPGDLPAALARATASRRPAFLDVSIIPAPAPTLPA